MPSKSSVVSNSSSTGKLSSCGTSASSKQQSQSSQLVTKMISSRIEKFKQLKSQQNSQCKIEEWKNNVNHSKLEMVKHYTKKDQLAESSVNNICHKLKSRLQLYDKINMKKMSKEHLYSPLNFSGLSVEDDAFNDDWVDVDLQDPNLTVPFIY
jgi:hypothetical protein